MSGSGPRIAIVGGGASGSIVAMNALRHAPDGCQITLIEKRPEIGRGVAYSTREADHRLNVRASNMSVFSDDSSHFTRWLSDSGIQTTNFDHFYAPRGTYGDYVADTLKGIAQASGSLCGSSTRQPCQSSTKEMASQSGWRMDRI